MSRMTDEDLRADLAKLRNKDMTYLGIAIGRTYVQTLVEEVLELRAAAIEAFSKGIAAGQAPGVKLALANEAGLLTCLAALDDAARESLYLKMHELYCRHCGSKFTEKHPVCHCENDE